MISLMQLWAPIILSGFLVFVGSSLVHMVLKWHNSDYRKLPNEDEVRAAIRKGNPAPGQYVFPHCVDPKEQAKPENQQKFVEGPVGLAFIRRNGLPNMGPMLGQWFGFNLVVSFFTAYVASRTLAVGTDYLRVFQIAGTVSFVSYAMGSIPGTIWMGKPWSVALKEMGDGLLYGLLTGGAFGWLWPR
ncbi:MAG TPA: hypothetical protein VH879_12690 [Gemmatimonadales bacterium]|jgi:hypothetical protein